MCALSTRKSPIAAVPKALHDDVTSPDQDRRLTAWRQVVPKLTPAQLSQLYGSEPDAVTRLAALPGAYEQAARAGLAGRVTSFDR